MKTVILCNGGGCPRIVVNDKSSKFRDDYKGDIKLKTSILTKLM